MTRLAVPPGKSGKFPQNKITADCADDTDTDPYKKDERCVVITCKVNAWILELD
jgi:hypothetical protein